MIKEVRGFVTKDGKFFETKIEAEIHESRTDLIIKLASLNITEDVLDWLVDASDEVLDYLEALEKVNGTKQSLSVHHKKITT